MAGYVRVSLSTAEFGYTVAIRQRRVFDFPNDKKLFFCEFPNGFDLLILRESIETLENGRKICKFLLYDKEFVVEYDHTLTLLFSVQMSTRNSYTFSVDQLRDKEKRFIGALKWNRDGLLSFHNETLSANKLRTMCVKARIMG